MSALNYGQRTVADAITERLCKLFPAITDVDMSVIASDLVEAADLGAVRTINQRETALRAAMLGLMDYYAGAVDRLHERIDDLEADRAQLTRQLAAYQQEAVASSNG